MLKNDHFQLFFRKKKRIGTDPVRCYSCMQVCPKAFGISLDNVVAEYTDAILDLSTILANEAIQYKIAYEPKIGETNRFFLNGSSNGTSWRSGRKCAPQR